MVATTEMEGNINTESSKIQKFFKDANIFLTGGSGFLGNLLIQKLLRDCPDISTLYLLIRSKKGKTPEERIEDMFKDTVFDRMKEEQPKYTEKIKLITGDIEQPDLGLNKADKKIIADQVNIIFHIAATVVLDGKIKKTANVNLRSTRDLIEIAKTITNLKVFVHVSTAYAHSYRSEINEQFYDSHMTPDRLLQITETLNDDELDILTSKLIGEWPNTYTFTKALAESVIQERGKNLPIAIVRPSMVLSTYKDPVEGWINNMYGPVGLSVGMAFGLVHVIQMAENKISDLVPADYVVNACIAAAWQTGSTFYNNSKKYLENNLILDELKTVNEPHIFNYCSGIENPLKWGEYKDFGFATRDKWKFVHAVWYCFLVVTQSNFATNFFHLLFHMIPAYIADTVLFILGKERRMVKIYEKVKAITKNSRFFTLGEWKFINNNTQALWQTLNQTDRRLFPFSMTEFKWMDYFVHFGRGCRIYLVKDPMETLPAAKVKYQKLKIAHYCFVSVISIFILITAYWIFQMFL